MQIEYENVLDDHLGKIHFSVVNTCDILIPAHWHEHLEIIYMIKGNITAAINDTNYELKEGDIFLVNTNDIHYTLTHGDSWYYLLQIPPVHLERISASWKGMKFLEYMPAKPEETEVIKDIQGIEKREETELAKLRELLKAVFEKIAELYDEKTKGYHLLVLGEVYRFLYLLYTKGIIAEEMAEGRQSTRRDLKRMKMCMEFAQNHYSEDISLADVAGLLSVTPEHFCRLFRKYTGQTFLAYVNQIRMDHFYNDLLETDENITFLLDKNGITNYKGFLKKFRDIYGESPRAVRQKKRQLSLGITES
ncbi:AraC family transcriptional regulator [Blautia sp. HCP3S3_H10_1]|uniref:AraC family transcriptional regulator n=1 Tax=unclassified Blautia TaxID=2648079 RepID=UPI003F909AC1|nr:AraC family transcriptional regulator [Clostridia bacterium]